MKYALCVGINDYPGSGADLAGCVNDANEWAYLLGQEKYQVETLTDAGATRANLVEALTAIVARAKWSDRIVFTFSGHGTWVPDRSADELDGRDEALCCHDYANGGLLLDDDLQMIFSNARRGVGSLIISDSCHSGTVSRFAGLTGVVPTGTPRFLSPSAFLPDLEPEDVIAAERAPASISRKTTSLVSGCADSEYSYDAWFGNRPNGAFTRAAIDTYRPGASLNSWYNSIRGKLPNGSYPQTPQLSVQSSYRKYLRAL